MTRKLLVALVLVVAAVLVGILLFRQSELNRSQVTSAATSNVEKIGKIPGSSVDSNRAKTFQVARDGTVLVPTRFQLPGVDRVRSASNFNDWVSQFPADQQTKIIDFGLRHFGVYSVNSAEQVAWMAEMGYPMPEDIVAAEKLSDSDLRNLATHGNDKAGFLLHERDVDALQAKYADLASQGQTRGQFWKSDPAAAQFNEDDHQYQQLLASSTSPFKGFVKAQDGVLEEDQQAAPATVISGLLWAETFGDFRVDQFIQSYVGNDATRMAIAMGAMAMGAMAMSANGGSDISALRNLGCPGFNVGNSIPGTVSPVQ